MGAITNVSWPFVEPYNKPLSAGGQFQPGCYLVFTSGGLVVPVYRDPQLLWPHKQTSVPGSGPPSKYAITSGVVADGTGRFPPIYLDPSIAYSYTLYSATGAVLESATNITSSDTTRTLEAVKPFITVVGSGTTPIIDPALQIGISTPGTYRVEANLSWAAVTNLGLQVGLYYSGTLTSGTANTLVYYGLTNGSAVEEAAIVMNVAPAFPNISTTALGNFLNVAGTIQVATSGVLSVKWSCNSAGVSVLNMSGGSALYAQKIG